MLEVGVGTAAVALPLADLGHSVVGIDLAPAMLAVAQDRLPGRLTLGDATRLPFRTGGVGAVIAVWAVHVIGDLDAMVAEVVRALAPGGRVPRGLLDPGRRAERLHRHRLPVRPRSGAAGIAPSGWHRLAQAGFAFLGDEATDEHTFDESPRSGRQRSSGVTGRRSGISTATWARSCNR